MRLTPIPLALLCLAALPVHALDDPAQVGRLAAVGAPDLALQLAHAALEKTPRDAAWRDAYWQAAAQSRRPADPKVLPPGEQAPAAAWAGYRLTLARQAVARGDWPAARRQWAHALWRGGLAPETVNALRAAIAQSWLLPAQAQPELINPVVLRLLQDDPKQLPVAEAAALHLLDLERPQPALELLDTLVPQSPLRALAQQRLGALTEEQAETRLRAEANGPAKPVAWQALLRLAEARNDAGLRVAALEALIGLGVDSERHAHALWSAYQALAEQAANRRQLLVGMEAAWLDEARLALKDNAGEGRALLAWLARQGSDTALRSQAVEALAESLSASPGLLAARLLGNAPVGLPRLPASLRYRLGEQARAGGDDRLAAGWWRGVSATEAGRPARNWYLSQAEINSRAGREAAALQWLDHALAPGATLNANEARAALAQLQQRLRQGRTDQVEALAGRLIAIAPPAEQRKAMQLIGELKELQGAWAEAAARQLLSAGEPADKEAQATRSRAVRNLERAGLHDDAARLGEPEGAPVRMPVEAMAPAPAQAAAQPPAQAPVQPIVPPPAQPQAKVKAQIPATAPAKPSGTAKPVNKSKPVGKSKPSRKANAAR